MNRIEAMQVIGRRVKAWTAANGVYTGVLKAVNAAQGKPWRGVVQIDGVLEVAAHFERGSYCRRGFRPGEPIEVGGQSIAMTEDLGAPSYEEALLSHIEFIRKAVDRDPQSPHAHTLLQVGRGSQVALEAERVRVAGGEWAMKPV